MTSTSTSTSCPTEPVIIKYGWLNKPPPLTQFSSFKGCKRRFCIILQVDPNSGVFLQKNPKKGRKNKKSLKETTLHAYYFVYWDTSDMRKKPIRTIPILGSYQASRFYNYEKVMKNVVSLTTHDRIYLFSAENEMEMNSWYEELYTAIENIKHNTIPPLRNVSDEMKFIDDDVYDNILFSKDADTIRCDSMTSQVSTESDKSSAEGDSKDNKVVKDASSIPKTKEETEPIDDEDSIYVNTILLREMRRDSSTSTISKTSQKVADEPLLEEITPYFISESYDRINKRIGDASQDTSESLIYEAMTQAQGRSDLLYPSTEVYEATNAMLQQRRKQAPAKPRRQTENLVKILKNQDDCEPRAYSIATSDASDVKPRQGTIKRNEGDKVDSHKKFEIKYSLNMSEDAVTLSIKNPLEKIMVDGDVKFTKDSLRITYGQYEIEIRNR